MNTYFSRFLHHILSHSDGKPQSSPSLSHSNLPGEYSLRTVFSATNHNTTESKISVLYGDKFCFDNVKCLKNLNLDDIYNFCKEQHGINSATDTELAVIWLR